jgi:hypothetical protein
MLYSSCQEKKQVMGDVLKRGDVISETTYDRLFVAKGIIPLSIFPVFDVGQPQDDLIARP